MRMGLFMIAKVCLIQGAGKFRAKRTPVVWFFTHEPLSPGSLIYHSFLGSLRSCPISPFPLGNRFTNPYLISAQTLLIRWILGLKNLGETPVRPRQSDKKNNDNSEGLSPPPLGQVYQILIILNKYSCSHRSTSKEARKHVFHAIF